MSNKSAIVTGASSGIGKAISNKLEELGYKVYKISRRDGIDLSDTKNIEKNISHILKDKNIKILVNAAGFGIFRPHEEIKIEDIIDMSNINLVAPMILTKLCLRTLKENEGFIFNITSIEAVRYSKFSALYSATKAGLRSFSLSLFEEVRKSKVKVISINPDMTKTPFFDELQFSYHEDHMSYIEPSCIVDVIEMSLNARDGTVISDITVRPQIVKIKKN
jgi:short-subunit dehydrogenase